MFGSASQNELLKRIERDLIDDFDEELEDIPEAPAEIVIPEVY
jgi:hypothetical protein